MPKNKNISGYALASVTIVIWGITFVCTKSLLADFSALEVLFTRFLLAYIGLWLLEPKTLKTKSLREEGLFMLAGFCGVTCYQLLENVALIFTAASNVSVIVSLTPIFTAIIAQIFLREKHISPLFVAGFALAIFGVTLVSFNGQVELRLKPQGDILALLAAISWGFYSLAVSKINSLGFSPAVATRRAFFWALVFMLPIVFAGGIIPELKNTATLGVSFGLAENAARFSKTLNWVNLIFLGLAASTFCFSAWSKACRILGTVRVSVGLYLIPVVTIVAAHFVLGERLSWMGLGGTLCTICGLALSNYRRQES